MKLIRLSDNKEFIKEYYEYLKTFFEIDDDKNFAKIKRILKQIDTFNFEICAKIQFLFFLYKYQKDIPAKKELEQHLNRYKRSLNINDI